jgi:hypothetical protein
MAERIDSGQARTTKKTTDWRREGILAAGKAGGEPEQVVVLLRSAYEKFKDSAETNVKNRAEVKKQMIREREKKIEEAEADISELRGNLQEHKGKVRTAEEKLEQLKERKLNVENGFFETEQLPVYRPIYFWMSVIFTPLLVVAIIVLYASAFKKQGINLQNISDMDSLLHDYDFFAWQEPDYFIVGIIIAAIVLGVAIGKERFELKNLKWNLATIGAFILLDMFLAFRVSSNIFEVKVAAGMLDSYTAVDIFTNPFLYVFTAISVIIDSVVVLVLVPTFLKEMENRRILSDKESFFERTKNAELHKIQGGIENVRNGLVELKNQQEILESKIEDQKSKIREYKDTIHNIETTDDEYIVLDTRALKQATVEIQQGWLDFLNLLKDSENNQNEMIQKLEKYVSKFNQILDKNDTIPKIDNELSELIVSS